MVTTGPNEGKPHLTYGYLLAIKVNLWTNQPT
jgi:hypothetical protein